MSENKFIQHLKGKATAGSVVEIKNQATPASFANMPSGTSNANNVYADVRGNATVVAQGTTNWKLDSANLVLASNVSGDGNDYTGVYSASGAGLWVNATYTFPSTGDPNHPVAMIFNPNTKWVLKLCGDNLLANGANTIDFSLVITIGSSNIITKNFTVAEQANKFCKEFIIDFAESNQVLIKAQGTTTMQVQLLCATASATARIYNGMTVLTALQRRVDGEAVATDTKSFPDVVQDIDDINADIADIQSDIDDINNKIIIRSATIPTASANLVGKVYQYAGATNGQYTHNYIYECVAEGSTYSWVRVDVQPDRIAQIQALQADVTDIQALIPAQASPTNQLGDKNFINSSIATNTANFIGTFNSVAELEAYSGTVTNNDYAFVIGTDSAGNTTYNRYKYNASTQQWIYEYTLNNSSFTAAQWAAINSGVTASDVSKARSAVQPSDVGNGTITITQGGETKGTFTTNQGNNTTIDLDSGGSSYHPDLFDYKWADHICNDVQWLRADTFSWQSGAVYQAAYQHLADDITGKTLQSETISGITIQFYLADDGHKICPVSQESNVMAIYNATGVAWYYIIDTTNQRFKLPRTKFGFTGIRSGVGKYVEAGIPNITGAFWIDSYHAASPDGAFTATDNYSAPNHGNWAAEGWRIHLDASRASSVYGSSDTVQPKATEMYLYFYVGNFTQTALENTAGVTTEVLNTKVTVGHEVIEFQEPTSANNYTWYRKYADGWVEQGGIKPANTTTVDFPVTMANNDYWYIVKGNYDNPSGSYSSSHDYVLTRLTTGFILSTGGTTACWEVKGMAA